MQHINVCKLDISITEKNAQEYYIETLYDNLKYYTTTTLDPVGAYGLKKVMILFDIQRDEIEVEYNKKNIIISIPLLYSTEELTIVLTKENLDKDDNLTRQVRIIHNRLDSFESLKSAINILEYAQVYYSGKHKVKKYCLKIFSDEFAEKLLQYFRGDLLRDLTKDPYGYINLEELSRRFDDIKDSDAESTIDELYNCMCTFEFIKADGKSKEKVNLHTLFTKVSYRCVVLFGICANSVGSWYTPDCININTPSYVSYLTENEKDMSGEIPLKYWSCKKVLLAKTDNQSDLMSMLCTIGKSQINYKVQQFKLDGIDYMAAYEM